MAYLTKQQTLIEWAKLVSQQEGQISSLSKIQQPQFTALLLAKLDPEYFEPAFKEHQEGFTLLFLFQQIKKYYKKQIGTNINTIIDENINLFSSGSIEQIWQLILGIAIKGRNRQKNINTILKMRSQAQQDLMRIISKIINRLGQNVSVIDNSANQAVSSIANNAGSNQTDIILELSEQNQRLKQKVDQLNEQINSLKDKNKNIKLQIEQRNKQKKQITNLIIKQSISSKLNFVSYSSRDSSSFPLVEFIKDMINQVSYLGKELSKKQQKLHYFEQVNRDLKVAYSTAISHIQSIRSESSQKHVDIKKFERQIQQIRSQNIQYIQRQKDLIAKISDLQQQKFYLKQIVQRLQTKNNISQQKIDKIISDNKVITVKPDFEEQKQRQVKSHKLQQMKETNSFIKQREELAENERQKTVKHEFDELRQPSQRNKLQRQVSHLQKKLNSFQEQNNSLKKINSILQKVINDFTKQSNQILSKYQSQFEPIFNQFQILLKEQKQKNKNLEQQTVKKQQQNQKKIAELLDKIKQKIQAYDQRQVQYQKIIKRLQLERDQLSQTIKVIEDKSAVVERIQPVQRKKNPLGTYKIEVSVTGQKKKEEQQVKQDANQSKEDQKPNQQLEQEQKKDDEKVEQQKVQEPNKQQKGEQQKFPEIVIQNEKGVKIEEQPQGLLIPPDKQKAEAIAASIVMEEEQEEANFRRRQYSFMGNKQSTLQFGNDGYLGFKQQEIRLSKLNSFGSLIKQESFINEPKTQKQQMPIESIDHIQIIDITQIEQQLIKIKQHYIGLSNHSQSLCQHLLQKKNNQKKQEPKQQNKMVQIVQKCDELSKQTDKPTIPQQYLKKLQQKSIAHSTLSTQNIRLRNENGLLKKQLLSLSRQRQAIEERLTYLHQQSSKNQEQRTKEQLTRLGATINQIRNIMLASQNSYLELQQYLCQVVGNGDKIVGSLNAQIQQLKQALKQRDYAVERLEMESSLLMGAVLEFRNCAVRTY